MKKLLFCLLMLVVALSSVFAAGDSEKDSTTITVAASPTPHAEILAVAAPLLEEKGFTLEVVEFTDYVMPNNVVESGEMDANYFQHVPYLESFNNEQGTHIINVGTIHYEPFGIYPGTENDLSHLSSDTTIAVPNDVTNGARALLLLQDNGIITLKSEAGLKATVLDIVENPYDVQIIEMEAAQIPRVIKEMSFVVLNGNYAIPAGLNVNEDSLAYETSSSDAAKTYGNLIGIKEGNENNPGILALVEVLKSKEVADYINETYDGAVVPFI